MKALQIGVVLLFAAAMLYATMQLPPRGAPDAPMHRTVSPAGSEGAAAHYIAHAYEDAKTVNIVTVILADYRGFDTLGEVMVVFSAAVACFFILGRREKRGGNG